MKIEQSKFASSDNSYPTPDKEIKINDPGHRNPPPPPPPPLEPESEPVPKIIIEPLREKESSQN